MKFNRCSGILLHITSLHGKYGIGTLGKEAFDFVDFLILSKQKIWQILPLGHTGYGDSPYQCFSAYAGNPILIDLDKLYHDGLLTKNELDTSEKFDDSNVEYLKVMNHKLPILQKAVTNFKNKASKVDKAKFEQFCKQNNSWLNDYAMFIAIKEHFEGTPWYEWERSIKVRDYDSMNKYQEKLKEKIEFYKITQFFFYKQWFELKSYANINGIEIMGDIPLYVAHDSADAWSHPEIFMFDNHRDPIKVAGVPPDYFSATGQLWGNPLYDWEKLRTTNFHWWITRIEANFKLYDIVRIDHFRGLAAFWAVPFGEKTAINGEWIKAPGKELFETIANKLGKLKIVAEDLGVITPDVEELRDRNDFPGMKILQFAFGDNDTNIFLPHNYINNCIVYTGTHDNDTSLGWLNTCNEEQKSFLRNYFFNLDEQNISWSLIRMAWSSVADVAIAPMQDILDLGQNARMNFPGKASGNWQWKLEKNALKTELAEKLAKITQIYSR